MAPQRAESTGRQLPPLLTASTPPTEGGRIENQEPGSPLLGLFVVGSRVTAGPLGTDCGWLCQVLILVLLRSRRCARPSCHRGFVLRRKTPEKDRNLMTGCGSGDKPKDAGGCRAPLCLSAGLGFAAFAVTRSTLIGRLQCFPPLQGSTTCATAVCV